MTVPFTVVHYSVGINCETFSLNQNYRAVCVFAPKKEIHFFIMQYFWLERGVGTEHI